MYGQFAIVYNRDNERKLRIFNFALQFSSHISINHAGDFVTFLDPECVAFALIRECISHPDFSRAIYLRLFDFLGRIIGEDGFTDLHHNLLLVCLYCHCAIRHLAIRPIESLTEMMRLGLKSTVFFLYPGVFSCREIETCGKESAQIRCSREFIRRGDTYIIDTGCAKYAYIASETAEGESLLTDISEKVREFLIELGVNGGEIEIVGEQKLREIMSEDANLAGSSYHRFLSELLTTLNRTVFSYLLLISVQTQCIH